MSLDLIAQLYEGESDEDPAENLESAIGDKDNKSVEGEIAIASLNSPEDVEVVGSDHNAHAEDVAAKKSKNSKAAPELNMPKPRKHSRRMCKSKQRKKIMNETPDWMWTCWRKGHHFKKASLKKTSEPSGSPSIQNDEVNESVPAEVPCSPPATHPCLEEEPIITDEIPESAEDGTPDTSAVEEDPEPNVDVTDANRLDESSGFKEAHGDARNDGGEFNCPLCVESFSKPNEMIKHLDTHILREEVNTTTAAIEADPNENQKGKENECHICDRSFKYPRQLKRHVRIHLTSEPEPENKPKPTTKQKGGKCNLCGVCMASFQYPHHLKRHMLTHSSNKPWKCSLCKIATKRKDTLKEHVDLCHKNARGAGKSRPRSASTVPTGSYKCLECPTTFIQKSNMARHVQSVHNKETQFKCGVCKKALGRQDQLQQHIAVVHNGERRFKCLECGWAFGRRHDMTVHVMKFHKRAK